MRFKQWLFEYEGFTFNQAKDYVNGPQYPNSKYNGPGDKGEEQQDMSNPAKKFGFKPDDDLLKLQSRRMKKKMRN